MRVSDVFSFGRAFTVSALAAVAPVGCGEPPDPDEPGAMPPVAAEREPMVPGCTAPGPLQSPAGAELRPPAGTELYLRLRADGTQIYSCALASSGNWQWSLKAPDARLIDDRCLQVGSHFAGPSWKIGRDGSAVVGRKAAEAPAPVSGAIPWLLIETTSKTGPGGGLLESASYIQRVDTLGGVAPTGGCDAAGAGREIAVPYAATYLYFRARAAGY